MNCDSTAQSINKFKEVMEFVQEQIQHSSNEWTHEKNLLMKKINELDQEITILKKANNDISYKISNENITFKNEKQRNLTKNHKRVESDKLKLNENKLAKILSYFLNKKINSEDLPSKKNSIKVNRRKTYSYGGFDQKLNNKLLIEFIQNNFNNNKSSKNEPNIKVTMYNKINLNSKNNNFIHDQNSYFTIKNHKSPNYIYKKKEKEITPIHNNSISKESIFNTFETVIEKCTPNQKLNDDLILFKDDKFCSFIMPSIKEEITENLRISFIEKVNSNHLITKKDPSKTIYNPIIVLKSHFDSVRELYVTPDSKFIVTVGDDMLINAWDFKKSLLHNKEYLDTYCNIRIHKNPIFTITGNNQKLHNNGYSLYSGASDGMIMYCRIIDKLNDKYDYGNEDFLNSSLPISWKGHQDSIWQLSHHPSENILSSVSSDGIVKIWRGYTDEFYNKLKNSFDSNYKNNILRQLTFKNHNYNQAEIPTSSVWSTTNKNTIYVSYVAPFIRAYDIETGKNKQEYKYYVEKNSPYECAQTNRLCINGSMNLIISANEDRQIRFYEEKQSKCIKNMIAHTDSVSSISMGNDENQLLTCSHDGSFRCWDIRNYKLLYDVPAHRKKNDEGCLCIIPDSNYKVLLTSGADGLVKIFKNA